MIALPIRSLALPVLIQAVAVIGLLTATSAAADTRQDVMSVLHMLDYVGVDYPEFVQDGEILDTAEYREQQEFAGEILARIQGLPEKPEQPRLIEQAQQLQQAVEAKAAGERIAEQTASLSRSLLSAYPVQSAPRAAPDVAAAEPIFKQQCASCHGAQGHGDGPAAAGLEPPPTDFHDLARQRQRSAFGLYNVITLGVEGTAMPSFAHLSEAQRWALAFYVGQMAYEPGQREAGAELWQDQTAATESVSNLDKLSAITPAALIGQHGAQAEDLMAYLRRHPEAVTAGEAGPLQKAADLLDNSLTAYRNGQQAEARRLALSAYLDGYELAEASVATVDGDLNRRIEKEMSAYREMLDKGAAVDQATEQVATIQTALDQAENKLNEGELSGFASATASFIILAREGLEAILLLVAMFAFLRKANRSDALPWVHAGWIAALVLGIATWFAATYLITISGANREITEGATALLAAAILLLVGVWLHNKSYAQHWQEYVSGKLQRTLQSNRLWLLTLIAFLVVYREVFETVLFYRALWAQGDHNAILAGFAAAALTLVVIAWGVFYYSLRLPIRQFFSWSSVLIAALAVIFTGKGVAALQEAGAIPVDSIDFISLPILGIYPTLQALSLQLGMLLLVLGGFAYNHLSAAPERSKA